MKIELHSTKIRIDGSDYDVNDLDSMEVEKYINNNLNNFSFDGFYVNEVFIKYSHAIVFLKNKVGYSKNEKTDIRIFPKTDKFLKIVLFDSIGRKTNVLSKAFACLYSIFFMFLSFVYLLTILLFKPYIRESFDGYDGFYVSRSKADKKMINALCGKNIYAFFDSFNIDHSAYYYIPRKKRTGFLFKALFSSFNELKHIKNNVKKCYGEYSSIDSAKYYAKRIVHTMLFEYMINYLLKLIPSTFYTADNIDRFALIEEQLCRKHYRKIVCIPHGIEYGFVLPHCFIGDVFFTTSENASKYLSKLYNSNKFVFDYKVAKQMFSVAVEKKCCKKIVYFTEPREYKVNIIILRELLDYYSPKHVDIYVKFHPADYLKNYESIMKKVIVLQDFNEAISNNICIARKSTILIESIYNNSQPLAILINEKDKMIFDFFPSLNDNSIIKNTSISQLIESINRYLD